MADDQQKRIKMCRYCDGMIEWGTEICPHCGKELELVKFDDLDFVKSDDAPAGPAAPSSPPVIEPIQQDATPVVTPLGPPGGGAKPPPPVLKPIAGKPTKPAMAKPTSRIRRRKKRPPPVAKPISRPPPVAKPIAEPPLVAPLPEDSDLPTGVSSVVECPICGVDTSAPADQGGICGTCDGVVCLPCLMRANGVGAGNDRDKNRAAWDGFLADVTKTIRCPACGQPGIH